MANGKLPTEFIRHSDKFFLLNSLNSAINYPREKEQHGCDLL